MYPPRKGARLWLGGRDTHVTARPNLFFAQAGPSYSPQAAPQNPTTQCPTGPGLPARRGGAHGEGSLTPNP